MPKYLFTGDLHLHERADMSTVDSNGLNSRLAEGLSIINQIAALAFMENVQHVFLAGDMFEMKDRIPGHMLNLFVNTINSKFHSDITILMGNHDFKISQFPTLKALFHNTDPTVRFVDSVREYSDGELKLLLIPYYRNYEDFHQKFHSFDHSKYDVVLFHQEVPGVAYNGKVHNNLAPLKYVDGVLYLSGHIHKTQWVDETFYLGSPYPTSFSEEGEEKFVYILDTKTTDLTAHKLDYSEFITVDITEGGPVDESIANAYVRIIGEVSKSKADELNSFITEIRAKYQPKVIINQVKIKKLKRRSIKSHQTDHVGVIKDFVTINKSDAFDKDRLISTGLRFL